MQRTHSAVCDVDLGGSKVFIFVEPAEELIREYGGVPDERDGVHAISFVLDSEEQVEKALRLTKDVSGL